MSFRHLECYSIRQTKRRDADRRALLRALGAAVALAWARPVMADSEAGICSFGVFPYLPALKIGDLFAPMAHDLGAALGTQVQLRTKDTFEEFASELGAGAYDIILVHPFLYVTAHGQQGYRAIARVDQELRAVIVGRHRLPAEMLAELRGETIAMVPLTAVTKMLRTAMLDEGLAPAFDFTLQAHQTKMSCLQSAAAGEAVGCVIPSILGDQLPTVDKLGLVPIWQSAPIMGYVVAIHPRLPEVAAARLQERLIGWAGMATGQEILRGLSWPGLVAAGDGDFEAVRQMEARLQSAPSG